VEVSSLTHTSPLPGLRGPSALLRLQTDERLIALTRGGQHAAFEALCARYQSRLLSFVRHMLGSREDAEDVLQEVFTAAFNAVLADARAINVRPWLYRIARNRSLNHLRRASAVGVDSMDVHFADHGLSTGDRVLRRESFRELLADVRQLPETQRTALLLREIDALSYEQIALAMDTTVPSIKSLLVRARISLAEAAEARKLSCDEVRLELGEVAEGLVKLSAPARRHARECERCRFFKRQLRNNNHALAAMLPVGPLLLVKKLLLAKLGSTASAGSAHVAGGAGATVGAGAAASAGAVGGAGAGGIVSVGAGALASKAAAGLAAAAIVSAGAVAAQPAHHHRSARVPVAAVPVSPEAVEPLVVTERAQPASAVHPAAAVTARHAPNASADTKPTAPTASAPIAPVPAPTESKPPVAPPPPTQVTQVTAETTQLPASSTGAAPPSAAPATGPGDAATTASTPPPAASTPPAESAPPPPESAPPPPESASPAVGTEPPAPKPEAPPAASSPPTGGPTASTTPSQAPAQAPTPTRAVLAGTPPSGTVRVAPFRHVGARRQGHGHGGLRSSAR
jgi:RNA polymerase sigma factor (sigma-70 family)